MQMLMYPSHTCDVQHTRAAYLSQQPGLDGTIGVNTWRSAILSSNVDTTSGRTSTRGALERERPEKPSDEARRASHENFYKAVHHSDRSFAP
jgi:hypothetical protein